MPRYSMRQNQQLLFLEFLDQSGMDLQRDPIEFELFNGVWSATGSPKGVVVNRSAQTAVDGVRCRIVGRVCMNMAFVDVTEAPHAAPGRLNMVPAQRDQAFPGQGTQPGIERQRPLAQVAVELLAGLDEHLLDHVGRIDARRQAPVEAVGDHLAQPVAVCTGSA